MMQRVKEQKEIVLHARKQKYKGYIHTAISINYIHKLNELESKMIEVYKKLNPTIVYLTIMLDLIPAWYQFKKKKKWLAKFNHYSTIRRSLQKEIERLEEDMKKEKRGLQIHNN